MNNVVNFIRVIQNIVRSSTNQVENEIHLYLPNGFYLGAFHLPADGQYWLDAKVISLITKALAIRWGLIQGKNQR